MSKFCGTDEKGRNLWELAYDSLHRFPAEKRKVCLLSVGELYDVASHTNLRWRLKGQGSPKLHRDRDKPKDRSSGSAQAKSSASAPATDAARRPSRRSSKGREASAAQSPRQAEVLFPKRKRTDASQRAAVAVDEATPAKQPRIERPGNSRSLGTPRTLAAADAVVSLATAPQATPPASNPQRPQHRQRFRGKAVSVYIASATCPTRKVAAAAAVITDATGTSTSERAISCLVGDECL